MTFEKRGNNWRCRVVIDGKQKSFTAPTKKECEQKILEYRIEQKEIKDKKGTLRRCTDKYIEEREQVISPTTLNSYLQYSRIHFQSLMDKDITDITLSDIQGEINMLAPDRSYKTINNIVTFYLSVLDWNDIYLPKKKLKFPQKKKLEYATPEPEDIKRIMAATKDTDIEIPVLLALWCSLRMGEVLGLKWKNVSEDNIIVNNTKVHIGKTAYEKAPKTTESNRVIPMPKYIWERLKMTPKNGEYVVPLTHYHIREEFYKILKENDIPQCRFHDLRHANASIMLGVLNINSKIAQARGGWSNPSVMENVYHQNFKSEEKKAAEQLDTYFEQLM